MKPWMNGWMSGVIDEWMKPLMDGAMEGWVSVAMIDGCRDG